MAVSVRPEVNHFTGATPQEKDAVELVAAHALAFERGIGVDLKEKFERYYKQYATFGGWRSAWIQAGPNDRDGLLLDAKNQWGANLHIPLGFRTIETKVPRAIAHRPRMLILPRHPRWEENVAPVRMLIDAQQDQIDIDLPYQMVMRSGFINGIGVGKTLWRKEYAAERKVQRRMFNLPGRSSYVVGPQKRTCVFDDPDFEDVDVFDFMWDPYGSDVRTSAWMLHRNWLSLDGCVERIQSGAWNTAAAQQLTEDKLRSIGHGQKYDEVWQERLNARGLNTDAHARGEQVHEVWEWHDGERVLTVLDRSVLVQAAENPCVGQMPFHVYRPTPLQKQMVGVSEIEVLEHLNRELDTLRNQRRDAATLALAGGYIYDDAAIEEDDLVFGPFAAIRASNVGDVRAAIMPIPHGDVPGSGYQEEQVIRADIDTVSGINDQDGAQGVASTATEAQLIQATLSQRIGLQSRRFEIEVVRSSARAFLKLDQRMILEDRMLRQPDEGLDEEQAMQEGRWRWFPVGPGELQGEFEIVPEGGSMAARNEGLDMQKGLQMMQLFGQNPHIDPRRPLQKALELFGIRDPEAWFRRQDAPVPPLALQLLQQAGVSPVLIEAAVENAQRQDPRLAEQEQGPDSAAVASMMEGSG